VVGSTSKEKGFAEGSPTEENMGREVNGQANWVKRGKAHGI